MDLTANNQRPSPYQGLVPYREEDTDFFFGRERETRLVIANLFAAHLTLLYGVSGVGKSSVLEAGVVHELRQDEDVLVVSFRSWQDDPVAGLKQAIAEAALRETGARIRPAESLADYLEGCSRQLDRQLMIILDQFEEYFLYHDNEDGAGTFAVEFPRAVNRPNLPVSFLVSIREDGLSKLDRFKGRIPGLFENCLRLEHLGEAAARAAIEGPIAQYNRLGATSGQPVTIEPELVEAVLGQVRTGEVVLGDAGSGVASAGGVATATETRIETPFLQLVMERLWAEEMTSGSHVLRLETLNRLGGAERIVRTHLDNVMGRLSKKEQRIAAQVFQYLVTSSGSKIAFPVVDLAGSAGFQETDLISLMGRLSGGAVRILRSVGPTPGRPTEPQYQRYEIFHDVLGPAILDWRKRVEERRTRRKYATAFSLTAVLLAVFIGISAFAFYSRSVAQAAESEAQKQARIATSLGLSARSSSLSDKQVDLALLLGVEATVFDTNAESRSNLLSMLQAHPSLTALLTGHRDVVFSVAYSPDGQTLASGSADGTIILWDVADPANPKPLGQPLTVHDNSVWSVAYSPDGQILASGSGDNTIILWDVGLELWKARACRIANRNLTQSEWEQYLLEEPYRKTCPTLPPGD